MDTSDEISHESPEWCKGCDCYDKEGDTSDDGDLDISFEDNWLGGLSKVVKRKERPMDDEYWGLVL